MMKIETTTSEHLSPKKKKKTQTRTGYITLPRKELEKNDEKMKKMLQNLKF